MRRLQGKKEGMTRWLCCQLGAREYFAVPRALHRVGCLSVFITDAWVRPRFPSAFLIGPSAALRDRFHPDLADAPVVAFTPSLIRFELDRRLRGVDGWRLISERNAWFQQHALNAMKSLSSRLSTSGSELALFAYSYAAADLFRYAKSRGWYTVLGQIDPGPLEEDIVQKEQNRISEYESAWRAAPSSYWKNWREECLLADRIVVNSDWSRNALQASGVDAQKISNARLAYELPKNALTFVRTYPSNFSRKRPLRVLFLGQVVVRKGVVPLLEAAKLLQDEPVKFWLVGPVGVTPRNGNFSKNVHLAGPVSRSAAHKYYKEADVFIFPTFSDGYGLTQLEAQAWKLPIIASRFCGQVVRHQENGLLLDLITPEAIATALLDCLNNPGRLQTFSNHALSAQLDGFTDLQKSLEFVGHAT